MLDRLFCYLLRPVLRRLSAIERTIMATQAETAARIDALTAKVGKIAAEVQTLKDALANSAAATDPAVTAALDRLDAALTGVDDMNPDADGEAPDQA